MGLNVALHRIVSMTINEFHHKGAICAAVEVRADTGDSLDLYLDPPVARAVVAAFDDALKQQRIQGEIAAARAKEMNAELDCDEANVMRLKGMV